MDERTQQKQLWTLSNVQGGALLIYKVIMNVAVFMVIFVIAMVGAMLAVFGAAFEAFANAGMTSEISPVFVGQVMETAMNNMGWGYLAQRYHIGWAVLLHLINNLVLGDLLPRILEEMPYEWGNILFWLLLIAGSVGAIVYALRRMDAIKRICREEPLQNWQLKGFITSPCILILIAMCAIDTLIVIATIFLL